MVSPISIIRYVIYFRFYAWRYVFMPWDQWIESGFRVTRADRQTQTDKQTNNKQTDVGLPITILRYFPGAWYREFEPYLASGYETLSSVAAANDKRTRVGIYTSTLHSSFFTARYAGKRTTRKRLLSMYNTASRGPLTGSKSSCRRHTVTAVFTLHRISLHAFDNHVVNYTECRALCGVELRRVVPSRAVPQYAAICHTNEKPMGHMQMLKCAWHKSVVIASLKTYVRSKQGAICSCTSSNPVKRLVIVSQAAELTESQAAVNRDSV